MSTIRTRAALTGAALVLAAGGATGGAVLTGDAGAASQAKAAHAKHHKTKNVRALNQTIRGAIRAAKDGERKRLTPDELRAAVAPAVRKAVADGTVPQKLVDRRAARLRALSDALGG